MDTQKILQMFNSAMELKNKGDLEQAASLYEEIVKTTEILPEVFFNLAFVYIDLDRQEEAIWALEKFLELEPEDTEGFYFLAAAYFKMKNYEKGFHFFEYRIAKFHAIETQKKLYPAYFPNVPFWEGQDLTDKTIYVYYEAGLGDTIMYFRYIKLLAQRAKKVYFKPQISLETLFKENQGDAEVIRVFSDRIAAKCDYQTPIMSLPYYLGLNNDNIFYATDKFIHAPQEQIDYYKQEYFNNDKLKIGIKWQGNTLIGGERAMSAESFKEICEIPNSQIYSIQVGEGAEQVELLKQYNVIDLGHTFKSFAETSGAIENLDIVICNDTSVAHLTGGMGKKCYCVLPKNYDWRWHMDISKCDWYDSIKLFRQKDTWEEVLHRIYEDIMKE